MLLNLCREKFGDFLPLIRRQDIKGFLQRRPNWLNAGTQRERIL